MNKNKEMIKKFGDAPYEWENRLYKRFVKTHHVKKGGLEYDYESVEADTKDMIEFIKEVRQETIDEDNKRFLGIIDKEEYTVKETVGEEMGIYTTYKTPKRYQKWLRAELTKTNETKNS